MKATINKEVSITQSSLNILNILEWSFKVKNYAIFKICFSIRFKNVF